MQDGEPESPRLWTWTTTVKLEVLEQYLGRFTTASRIKAHGNTVYLDLFAGGLDNVNKMTGERFPGSAELALRAEPEFRSVRLFEMPPKAERLDRRLRAMFPGRDLEVIEGDCNDTLPDALAGLNPHWPTFAYVDPDGLEVHWSTLQLLADHKRAVSRFKVELWILFMAPGLLRTLALDEAKITEADFQRADGLFGTEQWRTIYEMRRADTITGGQAREEYVNLMRWRLQTDLGYKHTHALEMKLPTGQPFYYMVFATDNAAGNDIMTSLYETASTMWPKMKAEREVARRHAKGQVNIWEALDIPDPTRTEPEVTYHHDEPWEPPGTA